MRTIKNKTYNNFMLVSKKIMEKGYSEQESYEIAHRLFDQLNPYGLSMESMIDRIQKRKDV